MYDISVWGAGTFSKEFFPDFTYSVGTNIHVFFSDINLLFQS